MSDDGLRINDELSVPESELTFKATRSGGPGGQHVNTTAARILNRLENRIDSRGVLRIVEGGSRSQNQNREAVRDRFVALLAGALKRRRPRKKTRLPRAAKEKRLREKKKQGEKKKLRGPVKREE
jgi:ribosome-associated protein